MKTYLLIRFDRYPREDVQQLLLLLIAEGEENKPQFIASPSALFTFFKSNMEHSEIYHRLAELNPPIAFFFFDLTDMPIALHFPEEVAKPLMAYLDKSEKVKISDLNTETEKQKLRGMTTQELQNMLDIALEDEQYEKCSLIQEILNEKQQ